MDYPKSISLVSLALSLVILHPALHAEQWLSLKDALLQHQESGSELYKGMQALGIGNQ